MISQGEGFDEGEPYEGKAQSNPGGYSGRKVELMGGEAEEEDQKEGEEEQASKVTQFSGEEGGGDVLEDVVVDDEEENGQERCRVDQRPQAEFEYWIATPVFHEKPLLVFYGLI